MARLLLLLLSSLVARVRADCYSHDGIKALDSKYYTGPELVSCGNGGNACCLSNEKCGTNLLCVDSGGQPTRQYCASKTWQGCSDMCPDADAAGLTLLDCGNNIFCCGGGSDQSCCTNSTLAYYVDPDNGDVTKTTQPAKTKQPRFFQVDSSSILAASTKKSSSSSVAPSSTSAPASASATPSSSSSSQPSASSSQSSSSGSPVSTGASTSSSSPSPSSTGSSSSGLSAGAGAGIGIGGAAVLALAGGLVWFLMRRRKQKAAQGPPYMVSSEAAAGVHHNEKVGPPNSYYAHHGEAPPVTEMEGSQHVTQELDGGAGNAPGAARFELDGMGAPPSKIPGRV